MEDRIHAHNTVTFGWRLVLIVVDMLNGWPMKSLTRDRLTKVDILIVVDMLNGWPMELLTTH